MHQNIGFNSFERLWYENYSEIKKVLDILRSYDNGYVSGSGGCLFRSLIKKAKLLMRLKIFRVDTKLILCIA